jgi:RNA polymerase sigma factor (sigma-70 family)
MPIEDLIAEWRSATGVARKDAENKLLAAIPVAIERCRRYLRGQFSSPAVEQHVRDVLDEARGRVWDKLHTFVACRGSFQTWLNRVLRNRCIDKIRKQQRHHKAILKHSHIQSEHEPSGDAPTALAVGGDEALIERISLELEECLGGMEERLVFAVVIGVAKWLAAEKLKEWYEGCGLDQERRHAINSIIAGPRHGRQKALAEALGKRLNTINQRASRARRRILERTSFEPLRKLCS